MVMAIDFEADWFAFAKVYTSKMPITACDLMHDRALPFYENLGITVGRA
jgi:hypothetical protein